MTVAGLVRAAATAPLTYAWLAILFVTTRRQRSAGKRGSQRIQRQHSTNLSRLRTEPLRVLLASLFWTDDRRWWPYIPVFVGAMAPAERRLRSWRWVAIGLTAHVVATYVGQEHLAWRIRRGRAPRRLVAARDVGVSYFVLGVLGAFTGCADRTWRPRSEVAGLSALAVNAAARPTYTEVGHLTAFVVGVAVARGRDVLSSK